MVQMVMNAVGQGAGNVTQHAHGPLLFQKLAGLAIVGSGYAVIAANLLHAITR